MSPSLLNLLSLISCFSHRNGSTVLNFVFFFRSQTLSVFIFFSFSFSKQTFSIFAQQQQQQTKPIIKYIKFPLSFWTTKTNVFRIIFFVFFVMCGSYKRHDRTKIKLECCVWMKIRVRAKKKNGRNMAISEWTSVGRVLSEIKSVFFSQSSGFARDKTKKNLIFFLIFYSLAITIQSEHYYYEEYKKITNQKKKEKEKFKTNCLTQFLFINFCLKFNGLGG